MNQEQLPGFLQSFVSETAGTFAGGIQHPKNNHGHLLVFERDGEPVYIRVKCRFGRDPWEVSDETARGYAERVAPGEFERLSKIARSTKDESTMGNRKTRKPVLEVLGQYA